MNKNLLILNIEDINWNDIPQPSTELLKRSKIFWNREVEEFKKEMKKERSEISIDLKLAKQIAKPWHDNPGLFHIDRYEEIIKQAVTDQWGLTAQVEFNRDLKQIKAIHESGLYLLI